MDTSRSIHGAGTSVPRRPRKWVGSTIGAALLLLTALGAKALFFDIHCSVTAGSGDSFFAISPDGREVLVSGFQRCTRGPFLPDTTGWSGVSEQHCLIPGTCRLTGTPWYWHVDISTGRVNGQAVDRNAEPAYLCERWPFSGPRGLVHLFTAPNTLPGGGEIAEDPASLPVQFNACTQYRRQADGKVVAQKRAFGEDRFIRALPKGWRYEYGTGPVLRFGNVRLEFSEQEEGGNRRMTPVLRREPEG